MALVEMNSVEESVAALVVSIVICVYIYTRVSFKGALSPSQILAPFLR